MQEHPLLPHLRGTFQFLRLDAQEIHRLFPDAQNSLPFPQRIYLEKQEATPLVGYPILMSPELEELGMAFQQYIEVEEEAQVAMFNHATYDRKKYDRIWGTYQKLLMALTENAITSSYGRKFPSIFWLYHSTAISQLLKSSPRRCLHLDSTTGREHGDEIKYRVFHRYLDRSIRLTYELISRVAEETEESEDRLFPKVLERMRDNVLIMTEDFIAPDLKELGSYFRGYLNIDRRKFLEGIERLNEWQTEELQRDSELRSAIHHFLHIDPDREPNLLVKVPGYFTFLSQRPGYDPERLLRPRWIEIYEGLLRKLKEFELLRALRRLVVPVRQKQGELVCSNPALKSGGIGPATLRLTPATRALDFSAPWVVDPQVERYGMIYDITDFSSVLSVLRRGGDAGQDRAFRMLFLFQRRINGFAHDHRLTLEKYLGDGAMYSCREPQRALVVAIQLQRHYRKVLGEDFPFDRGLRIAMNYGEYRLLPLQEGVQSNRMRYEFFGHGIVELTRLASGKSTQEVEEMKHLLVASGYSTEGVEQFFAPLSGSQVDLIDKTEKQREFYAYVNQNGTLVNEGIITTEAFMRHLENRHEFSQLHLYREGGRNWIVLDVEDAGTSVRVGARKLGRASLKGLGKIPIYEITDGASWQEELFEELPEPRDLVRTLDRKYGGGSGGSQRLKQPVEDPTAS